MGKKKGKQVQKEKPKPIDRIRAAQMELRRNNLFEMLSLEIRPTRESVMGKGAAALVNNHGEILVNEDLWLSVQEWVYVMAHCYLHLAFDHFDEDKVPGYHTTDIEGKPVKVVSYNKKLWNVACDIYVDKFLSDVKIGKVTTDPGWSVFPAGVLTDEQRIYDYLVENRWPEGDQRFGVCTDGRMDMAEAPSGYYHYRRDRHSWAKDFAAALAYAASKSVRIAGGYDGPVAKKDEIYEAAEWFMAHYPLLGAVAASFKIIRDPLLCQRNDIQIAAVNAHAGEIYINPASHLTMEETRFVLAHEYLHAGLDHMGRCKGRDPFLWNLACDFCINGWLREMGVGTMPPDGLYDASFRNMSAESIYDVIMENIREYRKLKTFRGYEKGDVLSETIGLDGRHIRPVNVLDDDFYKNALLQGLEYEQQRRRGFLPEGLVEEIRAITMPPIPWDVALAEWFQVHIDPLEKTRSYAHPSRRQSITQDIPMPRYISNIPNIGRTFGVVIDTSGSIKAREIGIALGAVASYAEAHDVPYARVVYCDAEAYDAGFIAPSDLTGSVEVRGRGGTILQPAIVLLESAGDFPKDGPILIITDGMIESNLRVRREHAYLLPRGRRLPFRPRGEVFYFKDDG